MNLLFPNCRTTIYGPPIAYWIPLLGFAGFTDSSRLYNTMRVTFQPTDYGIKSGEVAPEVFSSTVRQFDSETPEILTWSDYVTFPVEAYQDINDVYGVIDGPIGGLCKSQNRILPPNNYSFNIDRFFRLYSLDNADSLGVDGNPSTAGAINPSGTGTTSYWISRAYRLTQTKVEMDGWSLYDNNNPANPSESARFTENAAVVELFDEVNPDDIVATVRRWTAIGSGIHHPGKWPRISYSARDIDAFLYNLWRESIVDGTGENRPFMRWGQTIRQWFYAAQSTGIRNVSGDGFLEFHEQDKPGQAAVLEPFTFPCTAATIRIPPPGGSGQNNPLAGENPIDWDWGWKFPKVGCFNS